MEQRISLLLLGLTGSALSMKQQTAIEESGLRYNRSLAPVAFEQGILITVDNRPAPNAVTHRKYG